MSLILDALHKLEREKQGRDPNLTVLASQPWRTSERPRVGWLVASGVLVGVVVTAAVSWWLLRGGTHVRGTPVAPPVNAASSSARPAARAMPVSAPTASSAIPADSATATTTLPASVRAETSAGQARVPRPEAVTEPPTRRLALPDAGDEGTTSNAEEPRAATDTPAAPPPESARPAASGDLLLMAISQRDGVPIAIINDHLLRVGDSFDGVRVLRIGDAEVEVEVRGRRRVLRF